MRHISNIGHAYQSSISEYSYSEKEAENAITGNAPSGYAFHTMIEPVAWWGVDLGQEYPLTLIRIFKREGFESRYKADDLEAFYSTDLSNWQSLDHPQDSSYFGAFEFHTRPVRARFIKIAAKTCLFLFKKLKSTRTKPFYLSGAYL